MLRKDPGDRRACRVRLVGPGRDDEGGEPDQHAKQDRDRCGEAAAPAGRALRRRVLGGGLRRGGEIVGARHRPARRSRISLEQRRVLGAADEDRKVGADRKRRSRIDPNLRGVGGGRAGRAAVVRDRKDHADRSGRVEPALHARASENHPVVEGPGPRDDLAVRVCGAGGVEGDLVARADQPVRAGFGDRGRIDAHGDALLPAAVRQAEPVVEPRGHGVGSGRGEGVANVPPVRFRAFGGRAVAEAPAMGARLRPALKGRAPGGRDAGRRAARPLDVEPGRLDHADVEGVGVHGAAGAAAVACDGQRHAVVARAFEDLDRLRAARRGAVAERP